MQFSTLALALAGAAIAKAAVLERGVIPGSEFAHNRFELHAKATFTRPGSVTLVNEVPTPKFDLGTRGGIAVRAANYMTDNSFASTVVDAVASAVSTSAAGSVTAYITTTVSCSSSSSVPVAVTADPVATDAVPNTSVTITETCDCSSSTAGIPMIASSTPEEVVTAQSTNSHVTTIAVPATVASSTGSITIITNTTTNFRTQTVTLKTSSAAVSSNTAHTIATGILISVSAPHSVSNGTSSQAHDTGAPTGIAPSASYSVGSSFLPLSNGASMADAGSANFAILAFGLAYLLLRGQFD